MVNRTSTWWSPSRVKMAYAQGPVPGGVMPEKAWEELSKETTSSALAPPDGAPRSIAVVAKAVRTTGRAPVNAVSPIARVGRELSESRLPNQSSSRRGPCRRSPCRRISGLDHEPDRLLHVIRFWKSGWDKQVGRKQHGDV